MIKPFFLSFLFFVVTSASVVETSKFEYRNDYTYVDEYGAFYKFHRMKMPFSRAHETCTAEGAEIFIPGSAAEVSKMYEMFIKNEDNTWIGAHDQYGEGIFIAMDGKLLENHYVNWTSGEPALYGVGCITVNNEAQNIAYSCDSSYQYVCKKDPSTVVKNEHCNNYDTGYVFNTELNKCYKLHTHPKSWRQAFRICALEEASLVVVNTKAEAQMIMNELFKHPQSQLIGNFSKDWIHVGFNDIVTEGVYVTVDGEKVENSGYVNWAPGQPDNYEGVEHCGSMLRDGFFNDVNCDDLAMYFCERNITATYFHHHV